MSKKYNNTLNLPKTDFTMRANLPVREPEILREWSKGDLYRNIIKKNRPNKRFILHDGPPYANGDIHLGHALNKILKDFIVKFKNMRGYYSPFVPGWDTHGLPTEIKAKNSVEDYDKLNVTEIRKICKETAEYFINTQRTSFQRLGILADWEKPYITFTSEFEGNQIEVFAELSKRGAIYRGLKPVYWCSSCQTALAEAEIEYKQDHCESIFIKFKLKDDIDKFSKLKIDKNKVYFLIWTTTTWTLPGNVAVCLNGNFSYSIVKLNDEYLILASDLVDACMSEGNRGDYEIIGEFEGKALEGIKLFHPFLDRESMVILGDHVNLESGTGCVHTAPGHGIEDFNCCKNYKFDIIVPVDDKGVLTSEAGQFSGLKISDASKKIIEFLQNSNLLFLKKDIIHKYPHCWRCKSPVIFRATNQWFCSVDSFKDEAIRESLKVNWIPDWGRNRIESMIRERSDWCISRQRRWGVPIPIFFCKNCGKALIDYDLMKRIAKIFSKFGSGIWYEKGSEFFLNGKRCESCGSKEFAKEEDIMDVWFDSGSSHHAVLGESDFPADLYLEGSDQYRGWFQSSLLTSVGMGKPAPYKSVLTHGWVLDKDSRKQSKSLGNVISPTSIVDKYGADILRLWVSSVNYTDNVRISEEILSQISESYRKIRNTARFILGNLYDFDPGSFIKFENLLAIDRYILIKAKRVFDRCLEFYENFEFYCVFHEIQKFCITDLSNFYLDVIKDRLYVNGRDSLSRKSSQTTIWVILTHLAKILAPILSFTCEEIWRFIPKIEELPSIFLSDLFFDYDVTIDLKLEKYWEYIVEISSIVKKHLEDARSEKIIGSSLEANVVLTIKLEDEIDINNFLKDLKEVCMVSNITLKGSESEVCVSVEKSRFGKCQRCWCYDESVGKDLEFDDLCNRCIEILKK